MASACTVVLANDATNGGGIGGIGSGGIRAVRASSCVLMTIAIGAAVVLVLAGVFVVREYSLSASYEPASCRVENVTYGPRDEVCLHCATVAAGEKASKTSSGAACVSVQLPCLAVSVAYHRPEDSAKVGEHRAILHSDSLQAAGAHKECSFSVCLKTRDENQRAVEQFADQWRAKVRPPVAASVAGHPSESSSQSAVDGYNAAAGAERFSCFYDTADPGRVIVRKTYSKLDVIHCMLWPSLALVVSATVFLYLEARRTRLTCCGHQAAGTDEDGVASCGSSSTRDEKATLKVSLAGRPTRSNGATTPLRGGKTTNNNGTTSSSGGAPCQRQDAGGRSSYQGGCRSLTADERRRVIGDDSLTRLDDIGGQWSRPASRGDVDHRDRFDEKRPLKTRMDESSTSNGHDVTHRSRSPRQPEMMQRPEDVTEAESRRSLSRSTSSLVGSPHPEAVDGVAGKKGRRRSDDKPARHDSDVGIQATGDGSKPVKTHNAGHFETAGPAGSSGLPTSVCLSQRARSSIDCQLVNV